MSSNHERIVSIKEFFQLRKEIPYNLRQRSRFYIPPARTAFSGTESIIFLDPKIWELTLGEMKELESLLEFRFFVLSIIFLASLDFLC